MKSIIKLISAKLTLAMGFTVLLLGYSSAALGSDPRETVRSNLKDASAVGVLYTQENTANSCGLIVRMSHDSQSFDLAESSIREVFAQNNTPECDLAEDKVEEINLAIQMAATKNPIQLASLNKFLLGGGVAVIECLLGVATGLGVETVIKAGKTEAIKAGAVDTITAAITGVGAMGAVGLGAVGIAATGRAKIGVGAMAVFITCFGGTVYYPSK